MNPSDISANILSSSSSLSLPRRSTSKIDCLIEYSTIPEDANVSETLPPILSPYNIYRKRGSLPTSIRNLISSRKTLVKEYVQSSKLDMCNLPSTTAEQYITLEIPADFISAWKAEGYTHLHLGAIRIVLSYHGRKGLPVSARIALLDSRFMEYQHAIIGTVLTTLNQGSVVLSFFPNFSLSLKDINLSTALKVQVQISGAEQVSSAVMATLHHQLVYRLQNHALDLQNVGTNDALLVVADSGQKIPTIIEVPRQLNKEQLEQLMPKEWFTNYEALHERHEPIQTTSYTSKRLPDGKVKVSFETAESSPSSSSTIFQQHMITPVYTKRSSTPIGGFDVDGSHFYTDKINGHFIWDVDPSMCDPGCSCNEDSSDDEDDDYYSKKNERKHCYNYSDSDDDNDDESMTSSFSLNSLKEKFYEREFPPLKNPFTSNGLNKRSNFHYASAAPPLNSCMMMESSSSKNKI